MWPSSWSPAWPAPPVARRAAARRPPDRAALALVQHAAAPCAARRRRYGRRGRDARNSRSPPARVALRIASTNKFVDGTDETHASQIRERLTDPANDGRLPLWRAAVRIYRNAEAAAAPARAPTNSTYPRYRTESAYVVDAHSLYLQSLAELGIVGFVLILVVVLGILVGLAARIRGPDRALYAALFAVALAWAVHQAFDWDWQMPAVTLGVFILAGLALARAAATARWRLRGWSSSAPYRTGMAAAGGRSATRRPPPSTRLQRSASELQRGECTSCRHEALSSLSLSAKRPQAYVIVGVCDLEQGFAQAAVPAMAQAATLEPESWEEQYWLAVARAAAGVDPACGDPTGARAQPARGGAQKRRPQAELGQPARVGTAAPRLRLEALTSGKFAITTCRDKNFGGAVGKPAARSYRRSEDFSPPHPHQEARRPICRARHDAHKDELEGVAQRLRASDPRPARSSLTASRPQLCPVLGPESSAQAPALVASPSRA